MNDLRTAAQQALEALEAMQSYAAAERKGLRICDEAIPALRAALAQQAEPAQEPVAWLVMDESGYVQHAASWRDAAHEHINDAINEHDLVCARTWRVVPAYTAPPQRTMVPLTEEEIYHATGHCGVSEYTAINIARVIEEASWEKNHGQA